MSREPTKLPTSDFLRVSPWDEQHNDQQNDQQVQVFIISDLLTQARVSELLTANRNRRLTDAEAAELDEYERLEHVIRRAKIRAFEKHEGQTTRD